MVKGKLSDKDIPFLSKLYLSGLSSRAIAKMFDTGHSNILYHLRKLHTLRRDKSSAAKEGVKAGRILVKKNRVPENLKLNEDLSYILGVLAGDGYMDYSIRRRTYHIGLSATDKEFVEKFKECLVNFFKLKPTTEFRKSRYLNWNDQYITRLCSKEVCEYINSIGTFKKFNWKVPRLIKNSNNKIKSFFLKGFFDSEGEIDKKIGRIGATSTNLNGLNEIKIILEDLGIRSTIINRKDIRPNTHQKYVLRLHDKNSIKLFDSLIGFTIVRKQAILKDYVSKSFKEATMFPRDRDRLTP